MHPALFSRMLPPISNGRVTTFHNSPNGIELQKRTSPDRRADNPGHVRSRLVAASISMCRLPSTCSNDLRQTL